MSRQANPRASGKAHAVRIPDDLSAAVYAAAGGKENFAGWCRDVLTAAVRSGGFSGPAAGRPAGFREGWKAGWAAANAQFRRALSNTLAEPVPEP